MKRFLLCAVFSLLVLGSSPAFAAESSVHCDNLTSTLSSDKNYYIFTVQASGDTAAIVAYQFDFGDRQSYATTFPGSNQDHSAATVTHTYRNAGTYRVSVQVQTKTSSSTSDACKTTVQIGDPSALPSAGATGVVTATLIATALAFFAHQMYLRSHIRRPS
jgi:hypothetical protein